MLKKKKIQREFMIRFTSKLTVYLSLLFILLMSSCESPYEAEVDEMSGIISIEGSLIKGESKQTVTISRSTTLSNPEFIPVIGYLVTIIDELGNVFSFNEQSNGVYEAEIADDALVYNRQYKLNILSPEDVRYESGYEKLIQGSEVDSIYYENGSKYVDDREREGLQFYMDLKGGENDSRYYRWNLIETWEYHSIAEVSYMYIDELLNKEYTDTPNELFYCWKTLNIPGLYSSSTVNLSSNEKKRIPLHFLTGQTDRLKIKYSLLVKQYSLTEEAYNFWKQTKVETVESGGLHTQQPGQTQSNICNLDDSKEVVLGYFWAAAKTEKRIFVTRPRGFTFTYPTCSLEVFDSLAMGYPPTYIYEDRFGDRFTSSKSCMNCLILGGLNSKPIFWE